LEIEFHDFFFMKLSWSCDTNRMFNRLAQTDFDCFFFN
jgi:hypothetical protein